MGIGCSIEIKGTFTSKKKVHEGKKVLRNAKSTAISTSRRVIVRRPVKSSARLR